jgi:hypothetical protein
MLIGVPTAQVHAASDRAVAAHKLSLSIPSLLLAVPDMYELVWLCRSWQQRARSLETVLVTAVDTLDQFRRLNSGGGTAIRRTGSFFGQQAPMGCAAGRA